MTDAGILGRSSRIAQIRRSGAPRAFVTVSDPASPCWAHGGFGLRWVLTTAAGIRVQMRRLGVGLKSPRQRATEYDSLGASGSVSGSVAPWQADSGPATT